MKVLQAVGWVLYFVGLIWAIASSLKKGSRLWAILNLLLCFQPIIGVVAAILKKTDWLPVALLVIAFIISLLTTDYAAIQQQILDAMQQAK